MNQIILIIFSLCMILNKSDAYIALHKHITNWIIVVAPGSDTSNNQPGIQKAGAVYKCDIQDDNRCLMVPFDSKGNQFNDRGEQIDTKSNEWLGAAVSSGGENGPIVKGDRLFIGAPRNWYWQDNIRDKLTPLEVEMRYQLRGSKSKPVVRRKRDVLEPVIDQNRETVQQDSINIHKNCGADNICVPDLRLNIKTVDKYLLGSNSPLEIDVLVSNFGEDAFDAGFYMVFPEDLYFKKIQQIGDTRNTPITCTAPSLATNYTLKCNIGNPLPAGKAAHFKVVATPSQKSGMAPSYDFFMEANSTNLEAEGSKIDNIIRKSIYIWVMTDLAIEGISIPEFDHYNASEYKSYLSATHENDLGPQVIHIYNIRNNGPSIIEEVEVYIHWPYKTENEDTLMYMLQNPYTVGNIECDPSIHINPRNFSLNNTLAHKNYLETPPAIVQKNDATNSYQTSLRIDKSSSHSTSSIHETGVTNRMLTESEKRLLDAEESIESVGDASSVHSQRTQTAAVGDNNDSYGEQRSYSWNSSTTYDGRPIVMTSSRNKTVSIDNMGNTENSASIRQYTDGNYHDEYHNADRNFETHHSSSHSQQSSYGNRENIGEYNHRHKRNLKNDIPCKFENCGIIRCVVKHLTKEDEAWIAIRTRLVAATMKQLSENIPLNVSTMAVAQITRLPYIGAPKDKLLKSHEIFYKAIPEPIPSSGMVSL